MSNVFRMPFVSLHVCFYPTDLDGRPHLPSNDLFNHLTSIKLPSLELSSVTVNFTTLCVVIFVRHCAYRWRSRGSGRRRRLAELRPNQQLKQDLPPPQLMVCSVLTFCLVKPALLFTYYTLLHTLHTAQSTFNHKSTAATLAFVVHYIDPYLFLQCFSINVLHRK